MMVSVLGKIRATIYKFLSTFCCCCFSKGYRLASQSKEEGMSFIKNILCLKLFIYFNNLKVNKFTESSEMINLLGPCRFYHIACFFLDIQLNYKII